MPAGRPCIVCGRRSRELLHLQPWCGDQYCAAEILGLDLVDLVNDAEYDADELGLDPEEEYDA